MKDRIIGGFRIERALRHRVWPSSGAGTRAIPAYKAICISANEGIADVGDEVALTVIAGCEEDEDVRKVEKRITELSELSHPNIMRYRGCFVAKGAITDVLVIVQDLAEGETLKDRIAKHPNGIDADVCMDVLRQTLDALDYIQRHGVVHCNITPESILLCEDGTVRLTCFELPQWWSNCTISPSSFLFADYWAPELIGGKSCGDVQSDIFSMGVVMHEMLCGKKPYRSREGKGTDALSVCLERWVNCQSGEESPIRISWRSVKLVGNVRGVLERALSPKRELRYQNFSSFRSDLANVKFRDLVNEDNTYRILQSVGRGSRSEVFKVRHLQSGKIVAVKRILRTGYKFASFVRIVRELNDSAIVRIVDCFRMDDVWFVVMDYLPGTPDRSLRDAIHTASRSPAGHLPDVDVLCAFKRYAQGLKVIHGSCVWYMSISPSSLYYNAGSPDKSLIMDFSWPQEETISLASQSFPFGGLDYLAPETALGSRCDGRGDIYALGLSLYEAVSGKTAYPRLPTIGIESYAALLKRVKSKTPPTFDSPVVTSRPKLLQLLKDMTDIDPEKRIRDAAEVERRLSELAAEVKEQDQSIPLDELEGGIDDADTIMDENPLPPEELELLLKEQERLEKRRRTFWVGVVSVFSIGCLVLFKWLGWI